MPSYNVVVNFVAGVPTTITVVGSSFEKNATVGVYVNGVLLESAKTEVSEGDYDQTFTIPSEMKADLLNHKMFNMSAPIFSKSGSIGYCIVDKVKLELRYI